MVEEIIEAGNLKEYSRLLPGKVNFCGKWIVSGVSKVPGAFPSTPKQKRWWKNVL